MNSGFPLVSREKREYGKEVLRGPKPVVWKGDGQKGSINKWNVGHDMVHCCEYEKSSLM